MNCSLKNSLTRFSPLKLKNGRVLKNRIVVPPMASSTADLQGLATAETFAHYQRLAESGAGLVIVEYTYVDRQGRSEPNQLAADSQETIPGLTQIASLIKASGALAALQLTHAGGKTSQEMTGGKMFSPSGIPVPTVQGLLPPSKAMSLDQIQELKAQFLSAVGRAVTAGFDMVEFHAAHGYGLNQWLSPLTNQRNDGYGSGDGGASGGGGVHPSGRAKLLLEIISETKKKFPDLLVSTRIPGQDLLPGGLTVNDMQMIARQLEQAGVDVLNVSSGLGGWRRPKTRLGQGYLVEEARSIASAVGVPVIGVGGIVDGEYIDRHLKQGSFSLAAVGRAILNDPAGWGEKHLAAPLKVG